MWKRGKRKQTSRAPDTVSPSSNAVVPRWLTLESTPEAMSKLSEGLGVSRKDWAFVDVLGFENELLSMVPRPVRALMLLFPEAIIPTLQKANKKGSKQHTPVYEVAEENDRRLDSVVYMHQVVDGACGTIAVIHALANNPEVTSSLSPSCLLQTFVHAKYSWRERGRALALNTEINRLANDIALPPRPEEVEGFVLICPETAFVSGWKLRWLRTEGSWLHVYKDKQAGKPTKSFNLLTLRNVRQSPKDSSILDVHFPYTVYHFKNEESCSQAVDMKLWQKCLVKKYRYWKLRYSAYPEERSDAAKKKRSASSRKATSSVKHKVKPSTHGNHYVCFLPLRSLQGDVTYVVELDGCKRSPIIHGTTTQDTFLQDAVSVIRERFVSICKGKQALSFNLMALVKPPEPVTPERFDDGA